MKNTAPIKITENQANIILRALENESIDDVVTRGEYSYSRCHNDMLKKFSKAFDWETD